MIEFVLQDNAWLSNLARQFDVGKPFSVPNSGLTGPQKCQPCSIASTKVSPVEAVGQRSSIGSRRKFYLNQDIVVRLNGKLEWELAAVVRSHGGVLSHKWTKVCSCVFASFIPSMKIDLWEFAKESVETVSGADFSKSDRTCLFVDRCTHVTWSFCTNL